MKRFVRLTVLFGVVAGLSVLSNEGFAKGSAGGHHSVSHPATGHRITSHRVNQYGNGIDNPDKNPNYPSPNGFGNTTGGGGNSNPVKKHPIPVLGLQPVAFPTGSASGN